MGWMVLRRFLGLGMMCFFWNLNVLGGLKNGCFMGFWEVFDRVLTGFSWELMNL
jgi:hypothetical protein